MSMRSLIALGLGVLAAAAPAAGQSAAAPCGALPPGFEAERDLCVAVAQAVESAQPQLGVLVTGGNPTLGSSSTAGLRLGVLPGVGASLKLNGVYVRLPEIRRSGQQSGAAVSEEELALLAPALSGTASIGVFNGFSLMPTLGGVGSLELLGSATWLPFRAIDTDGFGEESPELAYGVGARIGLLRESFTTPGVSLSVMYHRLGNVSFGNVCDGAVVQPLRQPGDGYDVEYGACLGSSDVGEFDVDLTTWSTRAIIGKRLLGLGLAAGIGYDRYHSEVDFGIAPNADRPRIPENPVIFARITGLEVENDRWSAFVNSSFSFLLATVAAEAGWQQGGEALAGYPGGSDFDPERGTLFGSVGLRLAF